MEFLNSKVDFCEKSECEQNSIISKLKNLYLNTYLSRDEILQEMNMSMYLYKYLLKQYNLKRSREHSYKARCRLNLLKYGYENPFQDEAIKSKIKQTCRDKYGVEYVSQSQFFKDAVQTTNQNKSQEEKNKIVQKSKQTKLERYGDENYTNIEKRRNTNLKKYGCINALNNTDVINKANQTKLERYGDVNYRNDEKIKQTMMNKYGVEYPLQHQEFKNKAIKTCNKNRGVDWSLSSEHIRNKGKQTKLKLYGDENYNNIEKTKQTNLERYNVEYALQCDDFKLKQKNTMLERYGVENGFQLEKCINNNGITNSKINQKFGLKLKELNIDYECEFRIGAKSFDFKVGQYLVEINPSYTHNSTIGPWFRNKERKPLDKYYHQEKSNLAKKNGYFCIHVFDWDDWNKIINLLLPKKKIYARNCELKEVSKKECDGFLNSYHLQNTCRGQNIRLGLYYNDELVELMTFGKPRYTKDCEWELLRLCSHKNYNVVGGSEKLFKHFIKEMNPKSIVSYCDYSKFSGEVYEKLNFSLKSKGSPSCIWSKGREKITNVLLLQRGFDQLFKTDYGKGLSNRDLMIKHKWVEIYDCGQGTYIWNLIKHD